ncbi:uncharacterized protein [Rutidosis leptorrhynchoides]|uniref:uncharacterized protein isoform X1 n=1 Tax=Rutidosis leptorrhynchoides TaxID=125765 RepID=UPI003A998E6A
MGYDNKKEIPPPIKQLQGTHHLIEFSIETDKYGEPDYIFKRQFSPSTPTKTTSATQQPVTPLPTPASPEKKQEESSSQTIKEQEKKTHTNAKRAILIAPEEENAKKERKIKQQSNPQRSKTKCGGQ